MTDPSKYQTESETDDFSEYETEQKLKNQSKPVDSKFKNQQSGSAEPAKPLSKSAKIKSVITRTLSGAAMLFGFILLISAGHLYTSALLLFLNISIFQEITDLRRNKQKEEQVPLSTFLNWYFFGVGMFFFLGKVMFGHLQRFALTHPYLSVVMRYHNFAAFVFWIIGFLAFVMSLKKGFYRYQFRQFGWTHCTIILGNYGMIAGIYNNYTGQIWMAFPALLVIVNDSFAYFSGIIFGRTQLIELSPKKTWEGFIGGAICTGLFAFFASPYLTQFKIMVCPQEEIVLTPFVDVNCEIPLVFRENTYYFSDFPELSMFSFLEGKSISFAPFQAHCIFFALFVSLISPFAGFLASGLKRALKIKDFADKIPGHGGITDRMDCQLLTAPFVTVYSKIFIQGDIRYIAGAVGYILSELSLSDKLMLYHELKKGFELKGINMTEY